MRAISDIRLDGGRLCLDFINTIHDRTTACGEDYIATYERFLAWGRRSGAVGRNERFKRADGAMLMRAVRDLREAAHTLVSSRIAGKRLPSAALRALETWIRKAWRAQTLQACGRGALTLRLRSSAGEAILMRVALDALDLLRQQDGEALKRCKACGWLFIDNSRNRSRRWCAMSTCGVSSKMRTYRLRLR